MTDRRDESHPIPDCVTTGPLWVKAIAYPIYGFCAIASKIMAWRTK